MALATAPIGTDGDPLAIDRYCRQWQAATGVEQALWLPGVGDHGGGPTAEMLEQLQLWEQQPLARPQRHGTLRSLSGGARAPCASACRYGATSSTWSSTAAVPPAGPTRNATTAALSVCCGRRIWLRPCSACCNRPSRRSQTVDWRPLLFQQFHDILPGTSIPEVFEQAEPQWRQARRQAARCRDQALQALLAPHSGWWLVQLQLQAAGLHTLRLPPGHWQAGAAGLPHQPAPGGGTWVQLAIAGWISGRAAAAQRCSSGSARRRAAAGAAGDR